MLSNIIYVLWAPFSNCNWKLLLAYLFSRSLVQSKVLSQLLQALVPVVLGVWEYLTRTMIWRWRRSFFVRLVPHVLSYQHFSRREQGLFTILGYKLFLFWFEVVSLNSYGYHGTQRSSWLCLHVSAGIKGVCAWPIELWPILWICYCCCSWSVAFL